MDLGNNNSFQETNARLKTLDGESLNDELNNMTFDELLAHRDSLIKEKFGKEELLSEEKRQAQIDKLLQKTRDPSESETKPIHIHAHRAVKRIAIIAAIIIVLASLFTVVSVASKRDFSILNGLVRFENGRVYVLFSNGSDSLSKTMTEFEASLKEHGFENVTLPKYFYEGDWIATDVSYSQEIHAQEANVTIKKEEESYSVFIIYHYEEKNNQEISFLGVENGETIQYGDIPVYLFSHGKARIEFTYFINNYEYRIQSSASEKKMRMIAKTIM